MLSEELISKSIKGLSSLIRDGKLSPVELTDAVLEQITTYNPTLNAYIDIYNEEARVAAKSAEKEIKEGNYRGELHGIPMGIKDNIYMKDKITTMGSKIHKDFKPSFDATVIKRLREAGVIFTGKLNMHEYALGASNENPHYGPSVNPWNLNKITGGSSGGAGSAIPANMTMASLGTDTSGSIAIPSAMCGVVGLKPTYGKVSKYGCFPEAWSLDHIGPMGKTVHDVALLLENISGFDVNDPASVHTPAFNYRDLQLKDVSNMIIGVNESYFFNEIDDSIEGPVRDAIKLLEEAGAIIEQVELPSLKDAEFALAMTDFSELAAVHTFNIKKRPEDYGEDVRNIIELGHIPSAVDYLQAQQIRRKIKADFEQAFAKVDVLIAPSIPIPTKDIGAEFAEINGEKVDFLDNATRLTGPVNLAGLPSLSLPCGFNEGMPVGMQIIGPAFREDKILEVGFVYEKMETDGFKQPDLEKVRG